MLVSPALTRQALKVCLNAFTGENAVMSAKRKTAKVITMPDRESPEERFDRQILKIKAMVIALNSKIEAELARSARRRHIGMNFGEVTKNAGSSRRNKHS